MENGRLPILPAFFIEIYKTLFIYLYAKKDTVRKDGVFVLVLEETLVLLKIKDLNCDCCYVLHSLHMPHSNTDFAAEIFSSFGTHLLPDIGRV